MEENAACFGCMKGDCKKRRPLVTAENPQNLPLVPGQLVEAVNSPAALLSQALFTLLPLLVGFFAGFFLIKLIFPAAGEAARAAGGTVLLFAGGFGFYLFRRGKPEQTVYQIKGVI
jgi:positive regulator of sigma E activity